ncbi:MULTISPECIES: 5-(carboxyamino)imidazole ribonucleotide synthase [unclassified Oceanobacter]|uniref:5-(carboxyamino)imidazole ribonucleotide synthase n=1 Tax=unclassified Oceanobacter TaxID=2620260 RepID=UPI0026E49650|nr:MULTISPECIES: 5-(carboxyamino)imidazole ribonucleotide synthase [unclassified Oceanobacter]MDO6681746.1 5-(carboxyamino)imidazole ribonucleotide synthase [Oceanobacter sp. 5_MG-2023]MDP2505148.1 5-(carboxyamino)imidazole ribonucleotide synthase [Oceanobacter sp. 3_MG-2023]MDP2610162.1 5-(carboxyamino)imidazole ribonucleotide synthase [Oceanobacter sp. 1_MG-2023]MDP2613429.1 5-(carboxyamino)imidazole ribonucleotide synthase [Oceanobacter sp. 2_MG-2023]
MNIGILGNGQLGQMLAASITDLTDIQVSLYDLRAHSDESLQAFIASVDILSYETENIPAAIVSQLASCADKLFPSLEALTIFQNRLLEKNALRAAGIATAEFAAVNSLDDLQAAIVTLGLPIVLKTTTEGYDGKGQYVLRSAADAEPAWAAIGNRELIAEAFVPFSRETSVIASRDRDGNMVIWPMTENVHHEGILRYSLYPAAGLSEAKAEQARHYIRQLADSLDYVGTLTLELFETDTGLVANEVAPRVHNSGHWSIEGADTSQFRNHMLALAGKPLGSTQSRYPAVAMLNVISDETPTAAASGMAHVFVHSYGKEARPARKLGHVTVVANSTHERDTTITQLAGLLPAGVWQQ